jgi:hypothetical protein
MKRRSRKRNTRRANITAHRRAIADSRTSTLVRRLRRKWRFFNPIERGDRLRELVARGCSRRGLENELAQSATSIRRHLELASMPNEIQEVIRNGFSKKKVLAHSARGRRVQRIRARLQEDASTGKLSDELADEILDFCRADSGTPETPLLKQDLSKVLNASERYLARLEATARPQLRVSKRRSPKARLNAIRPAPRPDELWIEHRAEWLANLIWTIAPERPIWQRALQKVRKRSKELERKKSPFEASTDEVVRKLLLGLEPPRRRITGLAREVMVRQGRRPEGN